MAGRSEGPAFRRRRGPGGALAQSGDARGGVSSARLAAPVREGSCSARGLAATVDALRRGDFDGLNLTVPHKEHGLALADTADESARAIGAANTLVRGADGKVTAHNTDAPALAAELRRLASPASIGRARAPSCSGRGEPRAPRSRPAPCSACATSWCGRAPSTTKTGATDSSRPPLPRSPRSHGERTRIASGRPRP